MKIYFLSAASAFVLATILTPLVACLMRRWGIVDVPKVGRKIHAGKIPLGGGVALWLAFFLALFVEYVIGAGRTATGAGMLSARELAGIFVGSLILMIGGLLDDRFNLRARSQIIIGCLAIIPVILAGIRSDVITNPFGGAWSLGSISIPLDGFANVILLADAVTFLWLFGMMFTTKILDGLDGLVAGMAAIGALLLAVLSLQTRWYNPEVANLSFIFLGVCLGFLAWNWHPAKIFLGQGGSMFAGYMLAILAILAGGKIATAFLVLGVPILDMIRVAAYRVWRGKSIFHGDSEHLHYKLMQSGLSQRQAVLLLYAISFLFGMTTLFLQSRQLLVALAFLLVLMLLLGVWLARRPNLGERPS